MEEEWVIGVAKDLKPPEHENPEYLAIFPAGTKEGEFGPMICMVSDLSSVNDGDVAHAKIIVAAPKLLKALSHISERIQTVLLSGGSPAQSDFITGFAQALRDTADEAIKKATS